jgi:Spy/CpxP family protein refolding chaperone
MMKFFAKIVLFFCFISLSQSQVPLDRGALLNGEEGVMGKVADLHGYPSPKQVLDLAATLKLTDGQITRIREIYRDMMTRVKQLGKEIVQIEEELNTAFKSSLVTEGSVSDDTQAIGRLRGRMRGVFLTAHIQTKRVLTKDQVELIKSLNSAPKK